MKAQREFTFQMLPVLYDVSGVGIKFAPVDAIRTLPDFSSGIVFLSDKDALNTVMHQCKKRAAEAQNKHANDHVFYTDGYYVVQHRRMVVLYHPNKIEPEPSLPFESGQPHNVRF